MFFRDAGGNPRPEKLRRLQFDPTKERRRTRYFIKPFFRFKYSEACIKRNLEIT
jgi:hypothetical protein